MIYPRTTNYPRCILMMIIIIIVLNNGFFQQQQHHLNKKKNKTRKMSVSNHAMYTLPRLLNECYLCTKLICRKLVHGRKHSHTRIVLPIKIGIW